MAIYNRKITNGNMDRVLAFVKMMTKTMLFDENMESANWVKARKRNDLFYKLMPKAKGVKFKTVKLADKKALYARTAEPKDGNIIMYLHGGGFVTGNALVTESYSSMLAKYSGFRVYSVNYSLAPEHQFPAGFDDCCNAFEALTEMYPDSKITLVGESAGGNLCLAVALKYKASGKIASVIVHSPTTDFSGSVDHDINENKDIIVKKGCLEPLKRMYVGNNDTKNPYISPIYGDYKDFPPIYISCDANETLYADSIALYDKCVESGVDATLVTMEGAYHAYAISGTNTPETTTILEENARFMHKTLGL